MPILLFSLEAQTLPKSGSSPNNRGSNPIITKQTKYHIQIFPHFHNHQIEGQANIFFFYIYINENTNSPPSWCWACPSHRRTRFIVFPRTNTHTYINTIGRTHFNPNDHHIIIRQSNWPIHPKSNHSHHEPKPITKTRLNQWPNSLKTVVYHH